MINVNFQNSIQIDNLYIDPFKLEESRPAKYIFITHSHYDHLSIEDIKKIVGDNTKFIIPKDCLNTIIELGINKNNIIVVEPNKNYIIDDFSFKTIPAYNYDKQFHPKNKEWVGYLINKNNTIYYIVGDSDYIEEMNDIKCDILFVPVGGYYTMDYLEASKLIRKINPKLVIPTHYGPIIPASSDNAKLLEETLPDYDIKIYY